jgi:hypothetical protein
MSPGGRSVLVHAAGRDPPARPSRPARDAPADRHHDPAADPGHQVIKESGEMADVVFVVLTVAIFALFGLLVKAVGRL